MPHPLTSLPLLVALLPSWAWAQDPNDPFAWTEPPPEEQLANDLTEIPLGKGALFVPSLTGSQNEPPVILVDNDHVFDIPTGERVLIDPGPYVVIVSPGSPGLGIGQAIDIVEGETTLVPVNWGALRIDVTDNKRVPHRGTYELIRADTREPYGTGFGADTLQGEQLMTWLLPPGLYRIVKQGASYRSLTNWATVYIPEGGFVRYRLVTDPETGEFLAAGQLLPDDFGVIENADNRWFTSLVLGLDGSLVQHQNVVGSSNQLLLAGNLFIDGQVAYNAGAQHITLLAQVEQGASQIRPQQGDPQPFVKGIDRIRGDLLYTWYLGEAIGPYARVAAETQAFRTDLLVAEDTVFIRQLADGTAEEEVVTANNTFSIADAWQPTIVREGVGLNTRFLNNRWFTLNWRIGFGLRQNMYGGAFFLDDNPATAAVEYRESASFYQEGIESTIVATALLPGWAVYSTDLEVFSDFQTFTSPSLEWRNTLSLRLTRNLSLNYYVNVDYLPQVVADDIQLEQSVLFRASWDLL